MMKRVDYRHFIGAGLVLGSFALTLFVYTWVPIRVVESVLDFARAISWSFADLFEIDVPWEQTVNEFTNVDLNEAISIDLQEIQRKLTDVWSQIFVWINFKQYLRFLLWWFVRILYYVCWIFLFGLIFSVPVILTWEDLNNDHGKETAPLRLFKRFVAKPFRIVFEWLCDLFAWFTDSFWFAPFAFIWFKNFGITTVIFEFLGYYFWLITSFDFSTLSIQVVKLVVDVLLTYNTLPGICWAAIFIYLFDQWRIAHAYDVMEHTEARNCGLQKELPVALFLTAPPRTGKNTMETAMALTYAAMDRQKALELMNKNQLRFPDFPWLELEAEFRLCVEYHTVWNLATIRAWIRLKQRLFEEDPSPERIFGYNIFELPMAYNDHLKVVTIWDVLENYVQEFQIYWLQSSLILGNYAVREDFIFSDVGNFPLVDTSFFHRDARDLDEISTYAHVIDFDMMRLGVKMLEDNVHTGALEFGTILVSEIDKERKNDLMLREIKMREIECNQKNDHFNPWMKMMGHAAMVENHCFLHFLSDAQRPSSWGADARELTSVLHLKPHEGTLNGLPLFWIEDALISRYLKWWAGVYNNSRYKWGDTRLVVWILHALASKIFGYWIRRSNDFGYYQQELEIESGTLEGENLAQKTYFIQFKKVYAVRFASDCFKVISETQASACRTGLNDLPAYGSIYPTFEEWASQQSHFYNDLAAFFDLNV